MKAILTTNQKKKKKKREEEEKALKIGLKTKRGMALKVG